MADRETIAAILAAGLLPPIAPAENLADRDTRSDYDDTVDKAVSHAVSLYRIVVAELGRQQLP